MLPVHIGIYILAINTTVINSIKKLLKKENEIRLSGYSNNFFETKKYFDNKRHPTSDKNILFIDDLSFPKYKTVGLITDLYAADPVKTIIYTDSVNAVYLKTLIELNVKGIVHKNETLPETQERIILDVIKSVNNGLVCYDTKVVSLTHRFNWIREINYPEQIIGKAERKAENTSV